jgi:outer membrane lipoprotein-sorting protein
MSLIPQSSPRRPPPTDSRGDRSITRSLDPPIPRSRSDPFALLLLALLISFAPGELAGAQEAASLPPEAGEVLSRAVAAYSDGSSHASPFVQTYTPSGFTSARRESGTVILQAPQRLRFDYAEPDKKVFTYDGGEGRFYSPEDRQLTVRKLSEDETGRLPIVFLTAPEELARAYAITVEEGAKSAPTRLLFKPRSPRPELAWMRLTVDAQGKIEELSYEDASGNRTEFRFELWQSQKARPPADFRVTGPPGTRIIEN